MQIMNFGTQQQNIKNTILIGGKGGQLGSCDQKAH